MPGHGQDVQQHLFGLGLPVGAVQPFGQDEAGVARQLPAAFVERRGPNGRDAFQRVRRFAAGQLGLGQQQAQPHIQFRSAEWRQLGDLAKQLEQDLFDMGMAPLAQPEFRLGQQNQPLVELHADMAVVHQALGLVDARESA
ncbi:hypothetical protein D3C76_1235780 [compost metagenome]